MSVSQEMSQKSARHRMAILQKTPKILGISQKMPYLCNVKTKLKTI